MKAKPRRARFTSPKVRKTWGPLDPTERVHSPRRPAVAPEREVIEEELALMEDKFEG